jgi:group I intron endonuclease
MRGEFLAIIYRIVIERPGRHDAFYIGQTVDLESRIKHHLSALRGSRHKNTHLQRAFNLYGPNAFRFEVIKFCDDVKSIMSAMEQAALDFHRSEFGDDRIYNLRLDCVDSRLGMKTPKSTREKQSRAHLGRRHSEVTKNKISRIKREWKPPLDHVERLRTLRLGMKNSPEAIARTAAAKIGKKKSAEELARRHETRRLNAASRGYY